MASKDPALYVRRHRRALVALVGLFPGSRRASSRRCLSGLKPRPAKAASSASLPRCSSKKVALGAGQPHGVWICAADGALAQHGADVALRPLGASALGAGLARPSAGAGRAGAAGGVGAAIGAGVTSGGTKGNGRRCKRIGCVGAGLLPGRGRSPGRQQDRDDRLRWSLFAHAHLQGRMLDEKEYAHRQVRDQRGPDGPGRSSASGRLHPCGHPSPALSHRRIVSHRQAHARRFRGGGGTARGDRDIDFRVERALGRLDEAGAEPERVRQGVVARRLLLLGRGLLLTVVEGEHAADLQVVARRRDAGLGIEAAQRADRPVGRPGLVWRLGLDHGVVVGAHARLQRRLHERGGLDADRQPLVAALALLTGHVGLQGAGHCIAPWRKARRMSGAVAAPLPSAPGGEGAAGAGSAVSRPGGLGEGGQGACGAALPGRVREIEAAGVSRGCATWLRGVIITGMTVSIGPAARSIGEVRCGRYRRTAASKAACATTEATIADLVLCAASPSALLASPPGSSHGSSAIGGVARAAIS